MCIVVNGVTRPRPTQGCRAIDDDDDDNEVMISADDDFYYKKVIILKLQSICKTLCNTMKCVGEWRCGMTHSRD